MARLHMTLDHEVEVLEHQFARNGVQDRARDRALPRSAPARGDHRQRRHPRRPGRAHPDRRRHPAVPPATTCRSTAPTSSTATRSSTSTRLPRSLTVVGAGVIGVEYATIFSALDVPVTLVEPRGSILDFIDRELIDEFIHELRDRGIAFRLRRQGGARSRSENGLAGRPSWPTAAACARDAALRRRPRRRDRGPEPRRLRPRRPTSAAGLKVDPADLPDRACRTSTPPATSIGFPEPRLDLDGAGPHRRLPRLRRAAPHAAGVLPLRHLFGAGDLDGRHDRGGGARARHPLRVRHRAVPRDLARPHHGAQHPA